MGGSSMLRFPTVVVVSLLLLLLLFVPLVLWGVGKDGDSNSNNNNNLIRTKIIEVSNNNNNNNNNNSKERITEESLFFLSMTGKDQTDEERISTFEVHQNIRRLQSGGVPFCNPTGDNTYETVERGFLAAFIFRVIFRQEEGTCEEKCTDLCEHVECAADFEISNNGGCECVAGDDDAVKTSACGVNTECVEDTCSCQSGFVGNPLNGCTLPEIVETTSPSSSPPASPTTNAALTVSPTEAVVRVSPPTNPTTTPPRPTASPTPLTLAPTLPCDMGGTFCPGGEDIVCCTTNNNAQQPSCLATEKCCEEGKTYSTICGCVGEEEVCCSDRNTYPKEEGCPCSLGGNSCPPDFVCQQQNSDAGGGALILGGGECRKVGCTSANSCEVGTGDCCASGYKCSAAAKECIPIYTCREECDVKTEKCCDGTCIQKDECCPDIDGKECLDGTCAASKVNGCCQENSCGDACCRDGQVCSSVTNECVAKDCEGSKDPCCDPSDCTGNAGVFGDPHLTTFDGLEYDCMASGEFILLKSTRTNFEVHGHFTTVSERNFEVSVMTGVAIRPSRSNDMIRVVLDSRTTKAWIGNQSINIASGFKNDSIEISKKRETEYMIYIDDASVALEIENIRTGNIINIRINLPSFHSGHIVGLLGSPDGNRNNDWVQNFGSKYADLQICSTPDTCVSSIATDYCMKNWCVQDPDKDSLFLLQDSQPIFEETGCRAPSSYQNSPDVLGRSLLYNKNDDDDDPLLNDLCGDDLACRLDGNLFGYDAAKATVLAQSRLLENSTFVASPSRLLLNDPTLVTLTLNVKNKISLQMASGFVVYLIDEETGTAEKEPRTILVDDGRGAGDDSESGDFIFSNVFELTMTSPGQFYGFEAAPIINGVIDSDAVITKGRMIRSYTDFAIGDCFENKAELKSAIEEYIADNGKNTAVAKRYGWPIGSWCVSKIEDMSGLFSNATTFNEPLQSWNVSSVTDMSSMFKGASSFNQPLTTWDVSKVIDMSSMFDLATSLNKNFCKWGPLLKGRPVNVMNMFSGSACPTTLSPMLPANPPSPFCYIC